MEHQLGLLEWVPPPALAESPPSAPPRRATAPGLAAGVRIRVRSSETRSRDCGTIIKLRQNHAGVQMVQYRSDRNAGLYLVRVDLVRIVRWPRLQRRVAEVKR